jgi:hypothetical protein
MMVWRWICRSICVGILFGLTCPLLSFQERMLLSAVAALWAIAGRES